MSTPLTGDPIWLGDLPLNVIDGDGVEWVVTANDGWAGSPDSTQQVTQRQSDHGGYAGASYLAARQLSLAITVHAPSQALREQAVETLKSAATLAATTLRVQQDAYDRTATVRRQAATLVNAYGNTAEISVSLVAPDPRLYGTVGYSGSCQLPSISGGLVFPVTFPAVFAATVSSGQIPVGNLGNIGSRPLLRITGPCVTPLVTLQRPDGSVQQLTYNGTLAALDYLDLDCDRHSAILDATATRRGLITVTGGWPEIPPGAGPDSCALYFNAASTTGVPTLTASWTDAWE